MKIVLYKRIDGSHEYVTEYQDWLVEDNDYVILSEPVDIEFVRVPKEAYAEKVMAAFDEKERAARLELANKLSFISRMRQEFMAISQQEIEQ